MFPSKLTDRLGKMSARDVRTFLAPAFFFFDSLSFSLVLSPFQHTRNETEIDSLVRVVVFLFLFQSLSFSLQSRVRKSEWARRLYNTQRHTGKTEAGHREREQRAGIPALGPTIGCNTQTDKDDE